MPAKEVALNAAESDVAQWARAHAAGFEMEPLVEIVHGRPAQVGIRVSLFARLALEAAPGPDRRTAAEIRQRLREIVESLVPREGSRARVEVEPGQAEMVLEPEGHWEPEIAIHARVFHGDDYFAEATVAEEKKVYAVTRRLTEQGFKERRRRIY